MNTQFKRILIQHPGSQLAKQYYKNMVCRHEYYPTLYDSVCIKCGKLRGDETCCVPSSTNAISVAKKKQD